MTSTVYAASMTRTFQAEVVARRPPTGAYTVPTALLMAPDKPFFGEPPRYTLYFCAERRTGSYEWLSHCDGGKSFATEAEAREYAAAWR